MNLGISVLIVLLAWAAFFVLRGQFSVGGRFWRLVGRKPELALTLMLAEAGCIVDGERRDGHVGPFYFFDSKGQRHRVHISRIRIDEIQRRLIDDLR